MALNQRTKHLVGAVKFAAFFLALLACKSMGEHPKKLLSSVEHHTSMPMPTGSQTWHVQSLITSNQQPSREALEGCYAMLDGLSTNMKNDSELLAAKTKLLGLMSESVYVYHWCFFRLLSNLDIALEKSNSTFEEKGELFFAEMLKLWVLSRALDAIELTEDYFQFLKLRYIDISKTVFGRQVTTTGNAWDMWPRHDVEFQAP